MESSDKHPSLRSRLNWSLTISLLVLLLLQFLILIFSTSKLIENQLHDRLISEGENLLAILSIDSSGGVRIDSTRINSTYQRPFSGNYYIILTESEKIYSRSLWDFNLKLNAVDTGEIQKTKLEGPEGQSLMISSRGYKKHGKNLTIAIAEDLSPIQRSITHFQMFFGAISLIGLGILLLVQKFMVKKSLEPLNKTRESITKLAQGDVLHLENNGPSEVTPLVDEINHLLAGMDKKYLRSRESLGNLAHALKTRLAIINQIVEAPKMDKLKDVRYAILESTAKMHRTIESELKRARLLGDIRSGRKVDISKCIEDLVSTLEMIYVNKHIGITWKISPTSKFLGDKEDFMELMGNLLDNACKWSNNRVSLTVSGQDPVTFIVEDDGPGAKIHELELLTRRGYRSDESMPGSGLGLAIASDIVSLYDGQITFGKSAELGGLRVVITFTNNKRNSTPPQKPAQENKA
ncbi:MAG TPA: sensor histidine kinase [Methylophilus sp.]|nr:sensor histidine kinase [Methylophilus sp.]HQQ32925.1 sensor histidine kinase [Methylophilus sp.]